MAVLTILFSIGSPSIQSVPLSESTALLTSACWMGFVLCQERFLHNRYGMSACPNEKQVSQYLQQIAAVTANPESHFKPVLPCTSALADESNSVACNSRTLAQMREQT